MPSDCIHSVAATQPCARAPEVLAHGCNKKPPEKDGANHQFQGAVFQVTLGIQPAAFADTGARFSRHPVLPFQARPHIDECIISHSLGLCNTLTRAHECQQPFYPLHVTINVDVHGMAHLSFFADRAWFPGIVLPIGCHSRTGAFVA
jgi:hypothetical protein